MESKQLVIAVTSCISLLQGKVYIEPSDRGRGRGLPCKKEGGGGLLEILKRTPEVPDPVLWVWLEIFFIPKRYQF